MNLYEKYRGRVHFVIVDMDLRRSPAQQELVKKYYQGYIPHITILDKNGKAIYDRAGEVDESRISTLLDEVVK